MFKLEVASYYAGLKLLKEEGLCDTPVSTRRSVQRV